MAPDPKPDRRPKATPKPIARSAGLNRRARLATRPAATPARKPLKAKRAGKPPKVGTRSTVNPPGTFRDRVWTACGGRSVLTGRLTPHPDLCEGEFDAIHLIKAEAIRAEGLADWVYSTDVAVWGERGLHFDHDHAGRDTIRREHVPGRVWAAAAAMDAEVSARGGHPRAPFTARLEQEFGPR